MDNFKGVSLTDLEQLIQIKNTELAATPLPDPDTLTDRTVAQLNQVGGAIIAGVGVEPVGHEPVGELRPLDGVNRTNLQNQYNEMRAVARQREADGDITPIEFSK